MATSEACRPCRYFKQPRGCWFGDDCLFYHEGKPPNQSDPNICRYFSTLAGCRYGDKCRFIHTVSSGSDLTVKSVTIPPPDEDYHSANSALSSECDQSHSKEYRSVLNKTDLSQSEGERSSGESSPEAKEKKAKKSQDWKPKESYLCGECDQMFKGKEAYDKLLRHHMEMLSKMDKNHMAFLNFSHWFNQFVACGACGKDFAQARDLLRHLVDKSKVVKQKRDQELHHSLLEEVARAFADRDVGLTTDSESQEELLIYLTSHLGSDKGADDSLDSSDDEIGLGLYMLTGMSRMKTMDPAYYEDELEQKMANCGFTNDEVDELLCQGIKPWDDEAHAALAVLRTRRLR